MDQPRKVEMFRERFMLVRRECAATSTFQADIRWRWSKGEAVWRRR